MNQIVNKIKSMYRTSIIFSIILICIGIFLLINPETTLNAISYFFGILLIVWGLFPIIKFLTNKDQQNYLQVNFVIGVISFIFGIIIMIKPNIIVSIIPLLLGIWMIINGSMKLYYALAINKKISSISSIVISMIILLFGITLVCNPFSGAVLITKIIGISLIIYSILDLLECFNLKKIYNDIKIEEESQEKSSSKIIDVEYKEKKTKKK